MKKEMIKKYLVGSITVAAFVFFIFLLQGSFAGSYTTSDIIPEEAPADVAPVIRGYDTPSRLSIPAISVDAKVQHVGLTEAKAMANPTNFTDVGWYKFGTIPGEVGSAVIDGHVDNALGLPGVFKKLGTVKAGDDIYVTDKAGNKIHFKVTGVKSYDYKETPAEEIFHGSERSLLRLITCGGKWIRKDQTYDTRVVVTAEFVR